MRRMNKKLFFTLIFTLFIQGQAFMRSFYTATLYPKGKNFYICSKEDDYNLVTEEKMDEQNPIDILEFVKKLSSKTDKPVITYMIHDSSVLWFLIYENGDEIFIFDNSDEYFCDGKFIQKEKKNIPQIFGINENDWKKEINKDKFQKCIFADEFLMALITTLKLPDWVVGIGYNYLSEDDTFVSELKKGGINIEKCFN